MKTTQLMCMLILVGILSACSKKTDFSNDEKLDGKVRVAFTVDGFEQELVPFPKPQSASAEKGIFSETPRSGLTDIRDHINVLDIYVYPNRDSEAIDYVRQYADDDNFGSYEKYFDAESYTSSLFIAVHGVKLDEEESIEWTQVQNTSSVGVRVLPNAKDAFSAYKMISLKNSDQAISNIKLSRYVGRLDLNLEEGIPNLTGHLEITIENTAKYYNPFYEEGFHETRDADDTPYHSLNIIPVLPEQVDNGIFSTSVYFVPKERKGSAPTAVTVKIAAYDDSGALVQEMILPNVLIQRNKVTKLNGTIFTFPNLIQDINLDDKWDGEFPEVKF